MEKDSIKWNKYRKEICGENYANLKQHMRGLKHMSKYKKIQEGQ